MFDLESADSLSSLTAMARNHAPKEALAELGRLLTGAPAYPACNGMALHASDRDVTDTVAIRDLSQPGRSPMLTGSLEEAGLEAFDLQLSQSDAALLPEMTDMSAAFLAVRLGWLLRCLDLAFRQLEGRESFGIKLLHQPLIKAQFSEINAAAERLSCENQLPGESMATMRLSAHREVGRLFSKAAKLMGGRGLLEGQCHGLEFLDTVLFALIRPALGVGSDDLERG
ncbi:hypothetical protein PhaeoP23_01282 [Phaeobacter piscinae]|uniref:Acyl-CoA dehydrogenase n=1 Tax=Phaeobacter piscinae TaxID=1580596 RepID=A0ABM6PCL9_9RHOB|nr:hypothetical protein [Phaeobacter piscinae]ATG35433.1 hypothetical protein PhaeoP36_01282 [Phaeobacter piscinae]AUQ85953.1 hypothetical protein PhaeoP42_01282 [Phaeobacter piscinae]AUR23837.1 hypothetical protein PhaeoP23_01282 [Phaeobacter piscinae]